MTLSWIIWCLGIFLESLLLARGIRARLLTKFPFFYIYSASVLLVALLMIVTSFYDRWYWQTQFLTLIIGYGILLEILNHVLSPYPGAEKFARTAGLVAFGLIFSFALIVPLIIPHWSAGTTIEFERDLRSVQAIFICGLLAVVSYYGIPIGKNMKGMTVGYGLYIVTSLVSLAVRSYAGTPFDEIWKTIQPLSFDVSLVVWVIALWSYCPNPVPDPTIRLEEDYEALASRTRSTIDAIRSYIGKAARA